MRGIAEVAKERFRDFGLHMSDRLPGCGRPTAYRDHERFRTIIYCACNTQWVFKDAALRETPHILDYLKSCGLEQLVDPILNFKPLPGAWGKVLLGFLDEPDGV